jgi:hypothetical protein
MAKQNEGLQGPKFVQYFAPIVEGLKAMGGSARPAEATDWARTRSVCLTKNARN